jgi:hypothetical protein
VSYAGDANYSVASLQIPLAISQAAQSINFSPPAPVTFGAAPITLSATGGASGDPVTFSVVSGPASLTGNVLTISGAGKVSLMASQAGNIDYAAASVALTIAVAKGTPQVSVSSSVNPVLVQNAVTLTATVSSAAGAPGGQVNFLSGSTPLGSGTISGGAATLVTSALATGSDSITAIYQGDTNFTTAASSVLTEVVADFTLAASNGTATANPGGKADFTLNIDPASGSTSFPSAVTLSVTGLPAGATAVFTPASVAEGAGATAVTLAVQIPQNSDLSRSGHDPGARNRGAGAIALALLMAPLALRRARKRLHRTLWLLVLVMTGTAAMLGVTGCGSTSGFFGDLSHSDTLTVTASSGPLSHSTNLTLTVKPQGD